MSARAERVRCFERIGRSLPRVIDEVAPVVWAAWRSYEAQVGYEEGPRRPPWKHARPSDQDWARRLVELVLIDGCQTGELLYTAVDPRRPWQEIGPTQRGQWRLIVGIVVALTPEGIPPITEPAPGAREK